MTEENERAKVAAALRQYKERIYRDRDGDLGAADLLERAARLLEPAAPSGTLVVLRGNSGSGKSTVARLVQERFERGVCLVVPQDRVRREMLRELDVENGVNIELMEATARWGLCRGIVVVVEGIMNVRRYQGMLERLSRAAASSHFFAWDLPFEETVRRHAERPQRAEFASDEMADWYHGWQPLDFVEEHRFIATTTPSQAADAIVVSMQGTGVVVPPRAG